MRLKKSKNKMTGFYCPSRVREMLKAENRSREISWMIDVYRLIERDTLKRIRACLSPREIELCKQATAKHLFAIDGALPAQMALWEVLGFIDAAKLDCTPEEKQQLVDKLYNQSISEQIFLTSLICDERGDK